jgi:Tfp pilus assembly protein PilO
MKIENRQQFLVALTIGVAGLAILINFILFPLGDWWSARQTQIENLRKQVSEGQKLVKREAILRTSWGEMQTNALAANTSQAEQQFLKALDGWARDAGAEVTSIMPQWKSESTNYLTLACRVEAAGDLGSLSKLLYDVERGPLAVKLDSIELTARDATGQTMTLALELNGLALQTRDPK